MADEKGQETGDKTKLTAEELAKLPKNPSMKSKKETKTQQNAFELYYGMGDKRSLEAVANAYNKSTRTVGEWSRRFHWKDRIAQREIEEATAQGDTSNAVIDTKAEYRKIIRALIAKAVKDYKEGKLQIKNIQDFERVVKLDLLLLGDYTERVEQESKQQIELSEEDRRAIFAVADSIKREMEDIKG